MTLRIIAVFSCFGVLGLSGLFLLALVACSPSPRTAAPDASLASELPLCSAACDTSNALCKRDGACTCQAPDGAEIACRIEPIDAGN